jgi:hypothetical protein
MSASLPFHDTHGVVLDAVEQLGKAPPRLDGVGTGSAGQLTNGVSHSTPSLAEKAPDYESGGQEFESLRARQINI